MDKAKKAFLRRIALSNSIQAAFQHSSIYSSDDSKKRAEFRQHIEEILTDTSCCYKNRVCDEFHVNNISNISADISNVHGKILSNGRLRIGVAQKALNLYLKFSWLFGWIAKPPHCPFDRIVLAELDLSGHCCEKCKLWTKMDCLGCYRYWVDRANEKVQTCPVCISLADWEVCIWNKASPAKKELERTCKTNGGNSND